MPTLSLNLILLGCACTLCFSQLDDVIPEGSTYQLDDTSAASTGFHQTLPRSRAELVQFAKDNGLLSNIDMLRWGMQEDVDTRNLLQTCGVRTHDQISSFNRELQEWGYSAGKAFRGANQANLVQASVLPHHLAAGAALRTVTQATQMCDDVSAQIEKLIQERERDWAQHTRAQAEKKAQAVLAEAHTESTVACGGPSKFQCAVPALDKAQCGQSKIIKAISECDTELKKTSTGLGDVQGVTKYLTEVADLLEKTDKKTNKKTGIKPTIQTMGKVVSELSTVTAEIPYVGEVVTIAKEVLEVMNKVVGVLSKISKGLAVIDTIFKSAHNVAAKAHKAVDDLDKFAPLYYYGLRVADGLPQLVCEYKDVLEPAISVSTTFMKTAENVADTCTKVLKPINQKVSAWYEKAKPAIAKVKAVLDTVLENAEKALDFAGQITNRVATVITSVKCCTFATAQAGFKFVSSGVGLLTCGLNQVFHELIEALLSSLKPALIEFIDAAFPELMDIKFPSWVGDPVLDLGKIISKLPAQKRKALEPLAKLTRLKLTIALPRSRPFEVPAPASGISKDSIFASGMGSNLKPKVSACESAKNQFSVKVIFHSCKCTVASKIGGATAGPVGEKLGEAFQWSLNKVNAVFDDSANGFARVISGGTWAKPAPGQCEKAGCGGEGPVPSNVDCKWSDATHWMPGDSENHQVIQPVSRGAGCTRCSNGYCYFKKPVWAKCSKAVDCMTNKCYDGVCSIGNRAGTCQQDGCGDADSLPSVDCGWGGATGWMNGDSEGNQHPVTGKGPGCTYCEEGVGRCVWKKPKGARCAHSFNCMSNNCNLDSGSPGRCEY